MKQLEQLPNRLKGDKSFLYCNDGTGIRACIRVSDIAVISKVPSSVPPEEEDEYYQDSSTDFEKQP